MPHDNTSPTAEAGGLLDHRPCKCWGATLHVSEQTWESDGVIHHRDRPCERIAAAAAAAADPISPEPEPPAVEARHYRKDQWSHADIERGYRQWNIVAPGDQAFAAGVFAETGIPTFTEDEIDEMVAAVDADNGYEVDRTELIARTGMSEDEIAGYREARCPTRTGSSAWVCCRTRTSTRRWSRIRRTGLPSCGSASLPTWSAGSPRPNTHGRSTSVLCAGTRPRRSGPRVRSAGCGPSRGDDPGVSDHFLERIVRHGMGTSE